MKVVGRDPGDKRADDNNNSQGRSMAVEKQDVFDISDDEDPSFGNETSESDVDQVMMKVYESESLKDEDIKFRKQIISDLKSVLLTAFPSLVLEPYGSFSNGFGSKHSDLDLCASFEDDYVLMSRDRKALMKVLGTFANLIKGSKKFRRAVLIRARIPIVRFWHRTNNFEGDISLENIFAPANTRLLRTYVDIDPRVKILGLFLKTVMKMCDLNDAANGGLSSYGFSVLLIHYLQQVTPPVLPVLQEICSECDDALVTGNDYTIFFRDVPNLDKVWPAIGQNTMSVSELWTGFLNYYQNFNFEGQIVSIRQSEPATRVKTDKVANKGCFDIEDPFDTTGRSVAKMVSRDTSNYILKIFSFMADANYTRILEDLRRGYFRWRNGQKAALFSHHPRGMPVMDVEEVAMKKSGRPGSNKHWQLFRDNSRRMKEARIKNRQEKKQQKEHVSKKSAHFIQPPTRKPHFDGRRNEQILPPRLMKHLMPPPFNQRSNPHNYKQFDHRSSGNNFQKRGNRNSHHGRRH